MPTTHKIIFQSQLPWTPIFIYPVAVLALSLGELTCILIEMGLKLNFCFCLPRLYPPLFFPSQLMKIPSILFQEEIWIHDPSLALTHHYIHQQIFALSVH